MFCDFRSVVNRIIRHAPVSVFEKSLWQRCALSLGLCHFANLLKHRRRFIDSGLASKVVEKLQRIAGQCLDRSGIAVRKPERNCCFKLASNRFLFCQADDFVRQFFRWIRLQISACSTSCHSETPAKRLWSKSKRLQNPSQSMARNFWNRLSLSANYARPKNVSPRNQESQRASKRSKRPDRFSLASRFLVRSTFFSVSVTLKAFLPFGFAPAPFRFPPCFLII